MAPIISPCTQVAMTGANLSGRPWAIVQHWIGAGGTPPSPSSGSGQWIQAFVDNVLPVLSSSISVTGGSFVDLRTSGGASGPVTGIGLPASGGGSGTMCPPNTAILVTNATIGTRTQRSGRMYLPGADEDQIDAVGTLTGGYVSDLQDAIDAFWAALTDADIIPVVSAKASPTTYEAVTITGMAVQTKVATQRRRLRK